MHPVAYVQKSKKLLGYHPAYSLRTGLLKSAGWYWAYLPRLAEESTFVKKQQSQYTATVSA
jgi:hypothetical protein